MIPGLKKLKYVCLVILLQLVITASGQDHDDMKKVFFRPDISNAFSPKIHRDSIHPSLKHFINWLDHPAKSDPVDAIDSKALQVIRHPGYTSVMHSTYNIPAWVSHSITAKNLLHPGKYNRDDNYPKDSLYPALKSDAYKASGYDHGHLAPARDFKHDLDQYTGSNAMTNMTPQNACFNQKGWCYLESLCREWAIHDSVSTVYIVSGPILNSDLLPKPFIDTLCINNEFKIYVPGWFFKAICFYNKQSHTAKTIGFAVPNGSVDNEEIPLFQFTINELEQLTALDFFSALPNDLEEKAESSLPKMNYQYKSECGTKSCGTVYGKRVRPEKRVKCKCD